MDWSWALQFALAVASVVMDRQEELVGSSGDELGSAGPSREGRSSHRQGRIVAVPPGAPVTIGKTSTIKINFFFFWRGVVRLLPWLL